MVPFNLSMLYFTNDNPKPLFSPFVENPLVTSSLISALIDMNFQDQIFDNSIFTKLDKLNLI